MSNHVQVIEGGKRTGSAATLAKLAQALGVSVVACRGQVRIAPAADHLAQARLI